MFAAVLVPSEPSTQLQLSPLHLFLVPWLGLLPLPKGVPAISQRQAHPASHRWAREHPESPFWSESRGGSVPLAVVCGPSHVHDLTCIETCFSWHAEDPAIYKELFISMMKLKCSKHSVNTHLSSPPCIASFS